MYSKHPLTLTSSLTIAALRSAKIRLLPFRGNRYLFGAKWVNRLNQLFIKNKLRIKNSPQKIQ